MLPIPYVISSKVDYLGLKMDPIEGELLQSTDRSLSLSFILGFGKHGNRVSLLLKKEPRPKY